MTKTDSLQSAVIGKLVDEENLTVREAKLKVGDLAERMLTQLKNKIMGELKGFNFPPKDCISLASECFSTLWLVLIDFISCRNEPRWC